jgi:hypothetical protein
MNKTFKELGYKAGDTVRCVAYDKYYYDYKIGDTFELEQIGIGYLVSPDGLQGTLGNWELVCDPSDLTWGDMTPEQQGALLLAHHQGKTIEMKSYSFSVWVYIKKPIWGQGVAYRVKPEPVVVVHHNLYSGAYDSQLGVLTNHQYPESTHVLTYDTEDGVPVCSSVKLSKLT